MKLVRVLNFSVISLGGIGFEKLVDPNRQIAVSVLLPGTCTVP